MRVRNAIGIFSILLMLGGCETYLPNQPRFNSSILLPKGKQPQADGSDGTTIVRAPTVYKSSVNTPVPISCERADTRTATKDDRNDCIRDLEALIDNAFQEYQLQLQSDIGKTNSALNFGSLLLSTVGTAVKGSSAKTVLSAINAGVGGLQTTVSEDLLYRTTLNTLHTQMVADRAKIAARIETAMTTGITAYNIHAAYRDLIDYYYAGTLLGSLQSLGADAGAKAVRCVAAESSAKAAAQGATTQTASRPDDNGECAVTTYTYNFGATGAALEKIWRPDGKAYDQKGEDGIKACMTKLNITGNITELINGKPDADKNKVLGCYNAK